MAQKLECDRCAALAPGTISYAEKSAPHINGPKDWAFVTAPWVNGHSTKPSTKLLCASCVSDLHNFLMPLPMAKSES